jgi:hypothetical protein
MKNQISYLRCQNIYGNKMIMKLFVDEVSVSLNFDFKNEKTDFIFALPNRQRFCIFSIMVTKYGL